MNKQIPMVLIAFALIAGGYLLGQSQPPLSQAHAIVGDGTDGAGRFQLLWGRFAREDVLLKIDTKTGDVWEYGYWAQTHGDASYEDADPRRWLRTSEYIHTPKPKADDKARPAEETR